LTATPIPGDGGVPKLAFGIVNLTVLRKYPEKDMVIDPFGDGTNALRTKDVKRGISDLTVDPTG
jgi:hypothetical protein